MPKGCKFSRLLENSDRTKVRRIGAENPKVGGRIMTVVCVVFRAADEQLKVPLPFVRISEFKLAGLPEDFYQVVCEDGELRAFREVQLKRATGPEGEEMHFAEADADQLTADQLGKVELLRAVLPPVSFIRGMKDQHDSSRGNNWIDLLKSFQNQLSSAALEPVFQRGCPLKILKQGLFFDFKIDRAAAGRVTEGDGSVALCVMTCTKKFIIPPTALREIILRFPEVERRIANGEDYWSESVPHWAHRFRWY